MAASSILPVEGWEMVLDNLKDPQDLLNCSQVCVLWEAVLERRKPLFCFALVLPDLIAYLDSNSIIKCCSVSKSWNQHMDAYIRDMIESDVSDNGIRIALMFDENHIRFLDIVNDESCGPPVNLSLYRCVSFEFSRVLLPEVLVRPQELEFEQKMEECLHKYGQYIHHLILDLTITGFMTCPITTKMDYIGVKLQRWLALTPNLTTLQLQIGVFGMGDWVQGLPATRETLEQFPLPDLPKLHRLEFIALNCPEVFNLLLFKYEGQLKEVTIHHRSMLGMGRNERYLELPEDVPLSRLQYIEVCFSYPEDVGRWRTFFQRERPNLKKMKIECLCKVDIGMAQDIVTFVNEFFSRGLEEFVVEYNDDQDMEFRELEGLRLPNAKSIGFHGVGFPSAEVIVAMAPQVETLRLFSVLDSARGIYKDLYNEPTFWETLPTIKKVRVSYSWVPDSVRALALLNGNDIPRMESLYYSRNIYEALKAEKENNVV